jgi:adenine phosphoribosyltransferase
MIKSRTFPNFKGVSFIDLTPTFGSPETLVNFVQSPVVNVDYDVVVGVEARGFVLATAAGVFEHMKMNEVRIVLARKENKLPHGTTTDGQVVSVLKESYLKEYSESEGGSGDVIEIQSDAIKPGDKVLVIDDVLATGGTLKSVCKLVETAGGQVVRVAVIDEIDGLGGREMLKDYNVMSWKQWLNQ